MRFTVSISAQAGQDLEEIVFFITAREQDSLPAERFAHSLVEEARKLAELPHRGKVFQSRPNIRRLVHGNYLIIYEVREQDRHVEILRFIHGARVL
jgi:plasmid stabilization system protein ParE